MIRVIGSSLLKECVRPLGRCQFPGTEKATESAYLQRVERGKPDRNGGYRKSQKANAISRKAPGRNNWMDKSISLIRKDADLGPVICS